MATVIVPVSVPQGISISEQKCYLSHSGDNAAIAACLDEISRANGICMLVMFGILIALFVWIMRN